MIQLMGIINLTPDSFWAPSRYNMAMLSSRADIIDVGAVSTRPGAADVSVEEEWRRLEPFLKAWDNPRRLSIDTTSSEIVRRAYDCVGPFIVNDISAGEDDPRMLDMVGRLGLSYVAMHKKGNPRTMDSLCKPDCDIIEMLNAYFAEFSIKAEYNGIGQWILDPGLGFAKTAQQNIEIIECLPQLNRYGRPVLIGAADKRFTCGNTEKYHLMALRGGADILRVHDVDAAYRTYTQYQNECANGKDNPE